MYKGDSFSNIIRWNLNDPLTTSNSSWGFGVDITGYGSRANFTQPFPAENIVMLYDGYCASTCTLFSEWMHRQGGVKSIAMGGRPNKHPIQAIGGVKGAQDLGFSDVQGNAQFAAAQTTDPKLLATLNVLSDIPVQRSSTAVCTFLRVILEIISRPTAAFARFIVSRSVRQCKTWSSSLWIAIGWKRSLWILRRKKL